MICSSYTQSASESMGWTSDLRSGLPASAGIGGRMQEQCHNRMRTSHIYNCSKRPQISAVNRHFFCCMISYHLQPVSTQPGENSVTPCLQRRSARLSKRESVGNRIRRADQACTVKLLGWICRMTCPSNESVIRAELRTIILHDCLSISPRSDIYMSLLSWNCCRKSRAAAVIELGRYRAVRSGFSMLVVSTANSAGI